MEIAWGIFSEESLMKIVSLPLEHLKYNLVKESPEMYLLLINNSLTHLLPQVSFIIEHVFTAANK